MNVRRNFKNIKKILIKVGTSVVTQPGGTLALGRLGHLVEEIFELIKEGKQVALVSSGSVGQGRQVLRRQALLSTPLSKHISHQDGEHLPTFSARACAAAGQSGMMAFYETLFGKKGVFCSQVLLLEEDFRKKQHHIRDTLNDLMASGIVPIINENDVMSFRESGSIFSDNDGLASVIAQEIGIDLLLLLTDVPGIYDQDPKHPQARVIPVFTGYQDIVVGPKSGAGRGGMKSKIDAAVDATENGVPAVVIASGYERHTISRIINGENVGTLFTDSYIDTQPSSEDPAVKAKLVKNASHVLRALTGEQRSQLLLAMANELIMEKDRIIEANKKDLKEAIKISLEAPLFSRLKLDEEKINSLVVGIKQVASGEDPVGKILSMTTIGEGLTLTKETTPLGVVLVIFESRPDAIPQLASLAIRSANGLLLKGGKEANNTNKALHLVLTNAIEKASNTMGLSLSRNIIGLIESRKEVETLLGLEDDISLVIPRGSSQLVRHIQKNSRIPVLGHAAGICHIYVHEDADIDMAIRLIIDSKMDYPAACNSVETVLIHRALFEDDRAERIGEALVSAGVSIFAVPGTLPTSFQSAELVDSYHHEYSSESLTVAVVPDMTAAVSHINQYGSGHTESIITESRELASIFMDACDSACVFHNTSTRFADGFRFGLGAEVGISTSKLHARGPVGVDGLLTTKWKMRSVNENGDAVKEYSQNPEKYLHQKIDVNAKL